MLWSKKRRETDWSKVVENDNDKRANQRPDAAHYGGKAGWNKFVKLKSKREVPFSSLSGRQVSLQTFPSTGPVHWCSSINFSLRYKQVPPFSAFRTSRTQCFWRETWDSEVSCCLKRARGWATDSKESCGLASESWAVRTKWPKVPPVLAVPVKALVRLIPAVISKKASLGRQVLKRSQ